TALNCLAGLLSLSSGSVWLDSTRIDQLKPEARGFGMVFQNYALFPHMSVRKNIGFGLAMQGRSKADIQRKVDEALAIVRLGDQAKCVRSARRRISIFDPRIPTSRNSWAIATRFVRAPPKPEICSASVLGAPACTARRSMPRPMATLSRRFVPTI